MSTTIANGNDRYERNENGRATKDEDVILTIRVLMHGKVMLSAFSLSVINFPIFLIDHSFAGSRKYYW